MSDWKAVRKVTGHGYPDSECNCPLCDAVAALVRGHRLENADLKARLRACLKLVRQAGEPDLLPMADLRRKAWRTP